MRDHDRYAAPGYTYGNSLSKTEADPERCRWEVWTPVGGWYTVGQCSRRPTVDGLWCKQHSPKETRKREEQKAARTKAWMERADFEIQKPRAFEAALRLIAEGSLNDPVGLAQDVLEEWDAKQRELTGRE